MKLLKYRIQRQENLGTLVEPDWQPVLLLVKRTYNPENEEIARAEAYNGEYEIIEDGRPDPAATPSQLDVIEAQVTYTAMMTDTLLEV